MPPPHLQPPLAPQHVHACLTAASQQQPSKHQLLLAQLLKPQARCCARQQPRQQQRLLGLVVLLLLEVWVVWWRHQRHSQSARLVDPAAGCRGGTRRCEEQMLMKTGCQVQQQVGVVADCGLWLVGCCHGVAGRRGSLCVCLQTFNQCVVQHACPQMLAQQTPRAHLVILYICACMCCSSIATNKRVCVCVFRRCCRAQQPCSTAAAEGPGCCCWW